MNEHLDDYSDDEDDFFEPMLNSTLRYRKIALEYTLRENDNRKKQLTKNPKKEEK